MLTLATRYVFNIEYWIFDKFRVADNTIYYLKGHICMPSWEGVIAVVEHNKLNKCRSYEKLTISIVNTGIVGWRSDLMYATSKPHMYIHIYYIQIHSRSRARAVQIPKREWLWPCFKNKKNKINKQKHWTWTSKPLTRSFFLLLWKIEEWKSKISLFSFLRDSVYVLIQLIIHIEKTEGEYIHIVLGILWKISLMYQGLVFIRFWSLKFFSCTTKGL